MVVCFAKLIPKTQKPLCFKNVAQETFFIVNLFPPHKSNVQTSFRLYYLFILRLWRPTKYFIKITGTPPQQVIRHTNFIILWRRCVKQWRACSPLQMFFFACKIHRIQSELPNIRFQRFPLFAQGFSCLPSDDHARGISPDEETPARRCATAAGGAPLGLENANPIFMPFSRVGQNVNSNSDLHFFHYHLF